MEPLPARNDPARSPVPGGACPLTAALDVLDGKWKIPALWHLSDGPLRYGELRRRLPGISERMLVRTVRALERDGLVVRTQYPEVPPRVEYALTDDARTLVPILNDLGRWSLAHLPGLADDTQAAPSST